ncbi:hypothetical protein [Erythrobacter sp. A6_0]|uniref:hypothetical protein n=1 Tax=Erythrobacter sp. A6_0 TaxID=2821089 RepID=UPI001ADA5200|nr:hypothetical protein [Erythrobacter sp. A6_0]MBO9511680.1 hypothetical protein [Erythrobacter sp. A6_0]
MTKMPKNSKFAIPLLVALLFVGTPLRAEPVNLNMKVMCLIHYGDQPRPPQVTPIVDLKFQAVSKESAEGDRFSAPLWAVGPMLREKGIRFYKAHCVSKDTVEGVKSSLENYTSSLGYSMKGAVEMTSESFFPQLLDRMYRSAKSSVVGMKTPLSREGYNYKTIESAMPGVPKVELGK